MAKRSHGDGGIDQRNEGVYRLRYRVGGKRHTRTFHGTMMEARRELRKLLKSGDDGDHVAPDQITVEIDQWLALMERNPNGERRRGKVNPRTLERYTQLLDLHIKPTLGATALQKLTGSMIDSLYIDLEQKLATRTAPTADGDCEIAHFPHYDGIVSISADLRQPSAAGRCSVDQEAGMRMSI